MKKSNQASIQILSCSEKEPHLLTTGVYVDFGDGPSTLGVTEGQDIQYVFFPGEGSYKRSIAIASDASVAFRWIILWTNIEPQLSFWIEWSNIKATMDILAIAKDGSKIAVDTIARVEPGSKKVSVRVDQTNILIGKWASVRWRPVLEVGTDDVTGGHSLNIHRIEWENLFYLESRWVPTEDARAFLLDAEIQRRLVSLEGSLEKEKILTQIALRMKEK